jgi:hypothetical protein
VIDAWQHDRFYTFAEMAALTWLRAPQSLKI